MIGIIVALISGALMSIQGVFNTKVTEQAGIWISNGWVQLSAFLVCVIGFFWSVWAGKAQPSIGSLWSVQPKYMLLGGVIGAFITLTVIQSMAALGPAKAVMLIVISQLIIAYLIELFGIFGTDKQPLEWRKVIGMVIAIVGVVLFKWDSKA